MTDAAAGHGSGPRRASAALIVVLAVMLLTAPQIFVLAPLAGLLAVSRPHSLRALGWLAASLGGVLAWAYQAQGLFTEATTAWAILVTGAFVCLALMEEMPLLRRATIALIAGTAAALVIGLIFDVSWRGIEMLAAREIGGNFGDQAKLFEDRGVDWEPAAQMFRMLQGQAREIAALLPAFYVLLMLAGLTLAWRWYQIVADQPLEPSGGRFADFRFSDQCVWLVVIGLGGIMLGPPGSVMDAFGANVLLIAIALYVARGIAILRATLGRMPTPLAIVLCLVGFVLLIFTIVGLTVLGVADTWLDFRRLASDTNSRSER